MNTVRTNAGIAVAVGLALTAGCGGHAGVEVGGRVTLDGQPLAHARVEFQPIGSKENPDPGAGSYGVTDADGLYTLILVASPPRPGAVLGKHRVTIRAQGLVGGGPDDHPRSAAARRPAEPVPAKYNDQSELTFQVEPGPNQANFNLTTK